MRYHRMLILAIGIVACSGKDGTGPSPPPPPPPPPPPVAPSVSVSISPTSVEIGDTALKTVSWSSENASSCTSSWKDSISLSGSYNFTSSLNKDSTFSVTCTGDGGVKSATATMRAVPPPNLVVQVYGASPQGYDNVSGFKVIMSSGSWGDSLLLDNSGLGHISAPISVRNKMGNFLDVVVISPNNSYYRSEASIPRLTALTTKITFVSIPKKWVIQAGLFSGIEVDIQIAETQVAWDSFLFIPNLQSGGIWKDFPIPLAFDRRSWPDSISASDSSAFWNGGVADLEASFGIDLFRPAMITELAPDRGFLATINPSQSKTGFGAAQLVDGDLYFDFGGISLIGTLALRNSTIIQHELIHGLGFGHSCGWLTVMFGCPAGSPYNYNISQTTTKKDVAYIQLFQQVRRIQMENGATFGFVNALLGEQNNSTPTVFR